MMVEIIVSAAARFHPFRNQNNSEFRCSPNRLAFGKVSPCVAISLSVPLSVYLCLSLSLSRCLSLSLSQLLCTLLFSPSVGLNRRFLRMLYLSHLFENLG